MFAEPLTSLEDRAMVPRATGISAPSSVRLGVLREIAERYAELTDPLSGSSGVRGDGDSVVRMPRSYTPSVREFERLVVELREVERQLWWHLNGYWLSASTRTMWHCPRCGMCHQSEHVHPSRRHSGRTVRVKCRRAVVWSRLSGAQEKPALRALEWIAVSWSAGFEPEVPVVGG